MLEKLEDNLGVMSVARPPEVREYGFLPAGVYDMPKGITEGLRTMTANIVMEMGYASGLHREALIATGVVLFVFILLINLSVSMLNRRVHYGD